MKIDFEQTLRTMEGLPIKKISQEGKEEGFVTLGNVCINALLGSYDDERTLEGSKKVSRYLLATRIQAYPKPDLKVEEISEIKTLVGKAYPPLYVGQAFQMLEGGEKDEKDISS